LESALLSAEGIQMMAPWLGPGAVVALASTCTALYEALTQNAHIVCSISQFLELRLKKTWKLSVSGLKLERRDKLVGLVLWDVLSRKSYRSYKYRAVLEQVFDPNICNMAAAISLRIMPLSYNLFSSDPALIINKALKSKVIPLRDERDSILEAIREGKHIDFADLDDKDDAWTVNPYIYFETELTLIKEESELQRLLDKGFQKFRDFRLRHQGETWEVVKPLRNQPFQEIKYYSASNILKVLQRIAGNHGFIFHQQRFKWYGVFGERIFVLGEETSAIIQWEIYNCDHKFVLYNI